MDDARGDAMAGAAGPCAPRPILQLHPTLHCNLSCAHCYTESGPRVRTALGTDRILALLDDAWALGYRVLSISGGEPLIDRGLFDWLAEARRLGFQIDIATNAMLATPALATRLAPLVDIVAVSVDGRPEVHNELRGSAAAFSGMERGFAALQAAGIPTGIIHTARPDSLSDLRWLFGWAETMGACLLQVHVIEASGRARDMAMFADGEDEPEGMLETRVAMLVDLIGRDHPMVPVHCDALPVAALQSLCDRPVAEVLADAKLSEIADPLVVAANGMVVPLTHGLDAGLALGTIDGTMRLADLAPYWMAGRAADLLRHQRHVRDRVMEGCEWPYIGWHAALARRPLSPQPLAA